MRISKESFWVPPCLRWSKSPIANRWCSANAANSRRPFRSFRGFKGQVRWPEGPPHLALNPPYLFVFVFLYCFLFPFLSLHLNTQKNLAFPLEKGIFCLYLSVSPSFSLAFFGLPLFSFSFSFSVSLSLSLSCSCFFSSFLSFFLLCFGSLFLSLSFLFFLLCVCFMKRTSSKYSIATFFFINNFSFFWFPVLFFLSNPFFLSLLFPDLSYVFVQHQCFWFQNKQLNKTEILVKRGVATKRVFFMNLCFAKNVKSYRFFFFFNANFG